MMILNKSGIIDFLKGYFYNPYESIRQETYRQNEIVMVEVKMDLRECKNKYFLTNNKSFIFFLYRKIEKIICRHIFRNKINTKKYKIENDILIFYYELKGRLSDENSKFNKSKSK